MTNLMIMNHDGVDNHDENYNDIKVMSIPTWLKMTMVITLLIMMMIWQQDQYDENIKDTIVKSIPTWLNLRPTQSDFPFVQQWGKQPEKMNLRIY